MESLLISVKSCMTHLLKVSFFKPICLKTRFNYSEVLAESFRRCSYHIWPWHGTWRQHVGSNPFKVFVWPFKSCNAIASACHRWGTRPRYRSSVNNVSTRTRETTRNINRKTNRLPDWTRLLKYRQRGRKVVSLQWNRLHQIGQSLKAFQEPERPISPNRVRKPLGRKKG